MNELRVPKGKLPVAVALVTGVVDVELFLADYARGHAGPERATDVLENEEPFLPVRRGTGVELIARDAILWVRVEAEHFDDPTSLEGCSEASVALTLRDGSVLRGVARFVAPVGRARLLDVLNLPGQILTLFDGESVYLVRRAQIASVAFLESGR